MDDGRWLVRFVVAMLVALLMLDCFSLGSALASVAPGTSGDKLSPWCFRGKPRKLMINCRRHFGIPKHGPTSVSLRVVPNPPPAPMHSRPPPLSRGPISVSLRVVHNPPPAPMHSRSPPLSR